MVIRNHPKPANPHLSSLITWWTNGQINHPERRSFSAAASLLKETHTDGVCVCVWRVQISDCCSSLRFSPNVHQEPTRVLHHHGLKPLRHLPEQERRVHPGGGRRRRPGGCADAGVSPPPGRGVLTCPPVNLRQPNRRNHTEFDL